MQFYAAEGRSAAILPICHRVVSSDFGDEFLHGEDYLITFLTDERDLNAHLREMEAWK